MTSSLCYLLPLIALAIVLDALIVTGRKRLRELKETDKPSEYENLGRRELWSRAFFPFVYESKWKKTFSAIRQNIPEVAIPAKLWLLVAGVVSIIYSQYLLETRFALGSPLPSAERWNTIYKLEIVNYENLVYALPFLFGGAILCALLGMPKSWKGPFENWSRFWPKYGEVNWQSQSIEILTGLALFVFLLFRLSRHQYEPILPFLLLITILLFTHVIWEVDNNAKDSSALEIHASDFFWMTNLLILGFAICAFALKDIPAYIVPDEGGFWETARALARKEIHPAIFDSGVYTFPIASSIFQGWILKIFGVNLWGWRFASVIAAVITIIPLYLLAKLWFGHTAAITACIMMVANPYFISFSRMGYNNSQALFPVTLCIYFFAVAAKKGSIFYLWLAGLTIGFGFYTYFATWIGLVTLCFGIMYLWLRREVNIKQALFVLGIILTAWAVVFLPRIVYTVSGPLNEGLVYKIFETSFVNVFYGKSYYDVAALSRTTPLIGIGDHTIFYEPAIYGELIYRGIVRTFFALFDPFIISEHFLNSGLSGVVSPIFFLIGLGISLRYFKQLRFALPMIWLIGGMIFLSILSAFPPRHTHLVSVIPCMALLAGVGATAITKSIAEFMFPDKVPARSFLQTALVSIITLAVLSFGFQRYYSRMPDDYPLAFEDVASWLAWRVEKPIDIIYLGKADTPHRMEYLVNTAMIPHNYKSMLISEFSPNTDLRKNKPTIIFIDSSEKFPLQNLSLEDFGKPVSYKYRDEYIMGYAMTNTEIDLQPKAGIEDGLNTLINTPVRNVLLALLIILIITMFYIVRRTINWPQKEILLEFGKSHPCKEKRTSPEENETPEFDFHLRIRIPPRKRT